MNKKIKTLHPTAGKSGVNIDKEKYELVKSAMLTILENDGAQLFKDLVSRIAQEIDDFDGSVSWYAETVKLDLEAKRLIVHERTKNPPLIKLI